MTYQWTGSKNYEKKEMSEKRIVMYKNVIHHCKYVTMVLKNELGREFKDFEIKNCIAFSYILITVWHCKLNANVVHLVS